jgi:hypothetical protein
MAKGDVPKLTPGSKYRILSMMTRDEPLVSEGTFKGYTVVGSMDALCMEVEPETGPESGGKKAGTRSKKSSRKKSLRLIPAQMIISIDILSQKKEKKDDADQQSASRYYM